MVPENSAARVYTRSRVAVSQRDNGVLLRSSVGGCHYFSMIQPDRITHFTCRFNEDRAEGVVSFTVPELYKGKVHYLAERAADHSEIKEFGPPSHEWKFVHAENETWAWYGIVGDGDPKDEADTEIERPTTV